MILQVLEYGSDIIVTKEAEFERLLIIIHMGREKARLDLDSMRPTTPFLCV